MKRRRIITVLIVILASFSSGVLAGSQLSSKEARQLIARVGGISLSADNVHIRRISGGLRSKDAVVEALVQIGFKFTRQNGEWAVTHVRTGDRRWESVELVTAAVRKEKIKRTEADLQELAQALGAFRLDHEAVPMVEDFSALIDALLPNYLDRIIREDYWQQSYQYSSTPNGYRIISTGPDGKAGTTDDIVLEDGRLISQSRE